MPRKILIVEDERRIAKSLETRLQAVGYEVRTAADAQTAFDLARTWQPRLLLLDLCLPGGNGFNVIQHLQDELEGATPKVIIITASGRPGLRQSALDCGAVGFFTKPYDAAQLMRRVHEVLPLPPTAAREAAASESSA